MKKSIKIILTVILVVLLTLGSFLLGFYGRGLLASGFSTGNISNNSWGRIEENLKSLNSLIDKYYLYDYSEKDIENGIYKGMLEGLNDPYTVYYTPEEFDRLLEDTSGEFGGLGIYVDGSGKYMRIISPIKDSPADKAGLLSGDQILAVDGINYTGEEMESAVKVMRGEIGTKVTLTIGRENGDDLDIFDVELVRDNVKIETVDSSMLDENIGYIRISQFDEPTADDFLSQYEDLKKSGMKKLIIDLRNNPGGLLDVVAKIADTFMGEGPIVYQIDKNGVETTVNSDKNKEELPIVVLINEGSASASEILSGALKDEGAAKIVGMNSFGKGIVQRIFPLTFNDETPGIKITIYEYFTASKKQIHGVGIKPDYEVEMPLDTPTGPDFLKEDIQLQKAIEILDK